MIGFWYTHTGFSIPGLVVFCYHCMFNGGIFDTNTSLIMVLTIPRFCFLWYCHTRLMVQNVPDYWYRKYQLNRYRLTRLLGTDVSIKLGTHVPDIVVFSMVVFFGMFIPLNLVFQYQFDMVTKYYKNWYFCSSRWLFLTKNGA